MALVKYEIDFGHDSFDDMLCLKLIYSGCRKALDGKACEDCHNRDLWPFDIGIDGREIRRQMLIDIREWVAMESEIDGIVLIGGEPVDQDPDEVLEDIRQARKWLGRKVPVILYSGYDSPAEFSSGGKRILESVDYVKFGRYLKDLPQAPGSKLASANQRMYRVRPDGSLEAVDF